jgi:hypothetical protein
VDVFWLRITCLFVVALGAWALFFQWRTGEPADPVFGIFAMNHPGARRRLMWITTVMTGVFMIFLLSAAVTI